MKSAWDCTDSGRAEEAEWDVRFAEYAKVFPEKAAEFRRRMMGELSDEYQSKITDVMAQIAASEGDVATRKASQNALDAIAPLVPEFLVAVPI